MTPDLQNSIRESQKEQNLKIELEKARTFAIENGIDPDKVAVFVLGPNEMVIGETDSDQLLHADVTVKNPKRYLRLQSVSDQGLQINLILLDFDALKGDCRMHVKALAAYWVKDQSMEGQISTLSLFISYFKTRAQNRATEAGLIVPSSGILQRG